MRQSIWAIGLLGALVLPVGAAWSQATDADQILSEVHAKDTERQAALRGYTSDRSYRLEYTGVGGPRHAEMEVRAEYHAPGTKHFVIVSRSGSPAICEKVLKRLVESEEESSKSEDKNRLILSADRYDAHLVGEETVDGLNAWVLDVTPKRNTKFTYRGRIWVSRADYGVLRVVGEPAKNPSWLVNETNFDSRYERVGRFWLMAKNTTLTHVRLGGEARLTIEYKDYHLEPTPQSEEAKSRVPTPSR